MYDHIVSDEEKLVKIFLTNKAKGILTNLTKKAFWRIINIKEAKMNNIDIILLGIALAIDALIVSFTYGLILKYERLKNCLKLSLSFSLFQGLMPILGYYLTGLVSGYITNHAKWIVCGVFIILGIKFIKEALENENENKNKIICLSFYCLMYLSITTSIDAMAAGISIKLTNTEIISTSSIIAIITFVLASISFLISNIFKRMPQKSIMIIGAGLLFILAIKSII